MCLEAAGKACRLPSWSLLQTHAAFLSVERLESRALPDKEAPQHQWSYSSAPTAWPHYTSAPSCDVSEKGEVGYCCLSPSHPVPPWALSPIAPSDDSAGALTCAYASGGDAEMGTLGTALTGRHLQAPWPWGQQERGRAES